MATAAAEYYFRFRIYWRNCLRKVKMYVLAKFGQHDSVYGWEIITAIWEKETSAVLEFYFQFRFRPYRRNPHDILRNAAILHPMR